MGITAGFVKILIGDVAVGLVRPALLTAAPGMTGRMGSDAAAVGTGRTGWNSMRDRTRFPETVVQFTLPGA